MRSCTRHFSAAKSARRCARSPSDHCRSTAPTPPMESPSTQAGMRTSPESRARTRFRSSTRRPHASRRIPTTRRSSRRSPCRGHRSCGRRSLRTGFNEADNKWTRFPPGAATGIAVDSAGAAFVTGDADWFSDFKPTAGAFQKTDSNNQGAVVVKFAGVPSMTFSTSAARVDAQVPLTLRATLAGQSVAADVVFLANGVSLGGAPFVGTSATLTTHVARRNTRAGCDVADRRGDCRHAHRSSGRRATARLQLTNDAQSSSVPSGSFRVRLAVRGGRGVFAIDRLRAGWRNRRPILRGAACCGHRRRGPPGQDRGDSERRHVVAPTTNCSCSPTGLGQIDADINLSNRIRHRAGFRRRSVRRQHLVGDRHPTAAAFLDEWSAARRDIADGRCRRIGHRARPDAVATQRGEVIHLSTSATVLETYATLAKDDDPMAGLAVDSLRDQFWFATPRGVWRVPFGSAARRR